MLLKGENAKIPNYPHSTKKLPKKYRGKTKEPLNASLRKLDIKDNEVILLYKKIKISYYSTFFSRWEE